MTSFMSYSSTDIECRRIVQPIRTTSQESPQSKLIQCLRDSDALQIRSCSLSMGQAGNRKLKTLRLLRDVEDSLEALSLPSLAVAFAAYQSLPPAWLRNQVMIPAHLTFPTAMGGCA